MTEPTLSEMCNLTRADYNALVRDATRWRAMQAQEQSKGGEMKRYDPTNDNPVRDWEDVDPPSPPRRKGTTPLIVGKTYDPATATRIPPSPPEDALLARLSQHAQSCREFEQEVTSELLEEARDRIKADAEKAKLDHDCIINLGVLHGQEMSSRAAAEARAQRAKSAIREADKALGGMWSWNEDGRGKLLHTWYGQASTILRAAIASEQPEPSGKGKG